MSKYINKLLYVKRVRFKSGRRKDFVAPNLETLLRKINADATTFANRHCPLPPEAPATIDAGTNCVYMSRIGERPGQDGVYFEVGSYVYGRGEDQIVLNLSGDEPEVSSGPIMDKEGRQRAIVHIFRCVALGETLLVENQKGSGGATALIRLLNAMFRRHCDPTLPTIELLDVITRDLRRDIEAGGGVSQMMIRMLDGAPEEDDSYGQPMFNIRKQVKGAKKLNVFWEATDKLDTDDVLVAVDESQEEDSALDAVQIKLVSGAHINGVGKYRARQVISVTVDGHGTMHVSEIKSGLFAYLNELRKVVNQWRLIDDDGMFQVSSPVAVK